MTTQVTALTGNATNTLVATLTRSNVWVNNQVGIHAHGSFGGGTLTFNYSLDGGTTKVALKKDGSAISWTDSDSANWDSPVSTGDVPILVYATLSGSTTPAISVYFIDQNIGN